MHDIISVSRSLVGWLMVCVFTILTSMVSPQWQTTQSCKSSWLSWWSSMVGWSTLPSGHYTTVSPKTVCRLGCGTHRRAYHPRWGTEMWREWRKINVIYQSIYVCVLSTYTHTHSLSHIFIHSILCLFFREVSKGCNAESWDPSQAHRDRFYQLPITRDHVHFLETLEGLQRCRDTVLQVSIKQRGGSTDDSSLACVCVYVHDSIVILVYKGSLVENLQTKSHVSTKHLWKM